MNDHSYHNIPAARSTQKDANRKEGKKMEWGPQRKNIRNTRPEGDRDSKQDVLQLSQTNPTT